ncbi:11832_t:CDS:2 [Acaulospora colombiana]|uniref:11832_t:CDS:1 n=1 Tax=Acaulospora colombiana TaxID=27376 RepID=A0ACA9KJ14_9GLOM|nr:11832_t:CDS:2 [Acaulospora colombiana]
MTIMQDNKSWENTSAFVVRTVETETRKGNKSKELLIHISYVTRKCWLWALESPQFWNVVAIVGLKGVSYDSILRIFTDLGIDCILVIDSIDKEQATNIIDHFNEFSDFVKQYK